MHTDDNGLTKHLMAPDFFNVKKYPTAKFVSSKVVGVVDLVALEHFLSPLGSVPFRDCEFWFADAFARGVQVWPRIAGTDDVAAA